MHVNLFPPLIINYTAKVHKKCIKQLRWVLVTISITVSRLALYLNMWIISVMLEALVHLTK